MTRRLSVLLSSLSVMVLLAVCLPQRSSAQLRRYATTFTYSLHHFADTIPIEVDGGQIYVRVELGGREQRFCLDTGAGQGVVYAGSDDRGWRDLGHVVSRDAAGLRDTVRVVALPPLRLGRLVVNDYVASVMPQRQGRARYDGILGFDLINKGLSMKLDLRRGYMIIADQRDFFDFEPGYQLRYKLKWWVPYVMVSPFKRHTDEVLFDTGSRQLYTINRQSFDRHAYKSKQVEAQVESRVEGSLTIGQHGAEQRDEVAFLHLDRLQWDDFRFVDLRAMTTQGASRIGADILKYGTVTINGFRRTIRFNPYDGNDSIAVGNELPHIAYVPRGGQATVGLVVPGCDEYQAGLRQDDVIVSIDGRRIRTFQDFLQYPFVEGRIHEMKVRTSEGKDKTIKYKVREKSEQ